MRTVSCKKDERIVSKKMLCLACITLIIVLLAKVRSIQAETDQVFPIRHKGFIEPLMDRYTVVGILLNNGSDHATNIHVTCIFRDSEGQLVTVEEDTIDRGLLSFEDLILPPGWEVPFEFEVSETILSEQIASYELSVTYSKLTQVNKSHCLHVMELSFRLAERNDLFEYEKWIVSGMIKNLSTENSTDTYVKAIFLDSDELPVGYAGHGFGIQPETILPAETALFSLETLVPMYSDVAGVQLIIEGDEAFGCYPCMSYKSRFTLKWETKSFIINIISNSSVGNIDLNQTARKLSFHVAGENGTGGFCNITIPRELLYCQEPSEWSITINGKHVVHQTIETETSTSLYFSYQHSLKSIDIQGTKVIPEFSSFIILPLFMIATLLAVITYKRRFV